MHGGTTYHSTCNSNLRTGQYNKVPVIIGTNSDEGAMNVVGYLDGRASFDDANEFWEESMGPLILFHRSMDETTEEDRKMARTIKELYFQKKNISKGELLYKSFVRKMALLVKYQSQSEVIKVKTAVTF